MEQKYDIIILRFGEVFLKKSNRSSFLSALAGNIRRLLKDHKGCELKKWHSRMGILLEEPQSREELTPLLEDLRHAFGIVSMSPALRVEQDMEEMKAGALQVARRALADGAKTFAVRAKRSEKTFPLKSDGINQQVGGYIDDELPLKVNLTRPDVTVELLLFDGRAVVYCERVPGPGGLPAKVSGKAMMLLSGGIDSPVATYLMMKRGVAMEGIYFHSPPLVSEAAREKVMDLSSVLARYQGDFMLHVVPFTAIQKAIRKHCDHRQTVLLYRRFMMRISALVAKSRGVHVLSTGENLGQVASQTLKNLECIEESVNLPILRPLLTFDKVETIQIAKQIETFDISIRPADDCCSLFVPRHPETKGNINFLKSQEDKLDVDELIGEAISEVTRVRVI